MPYKKIIAIDDDYKHLVNIRADKEKNLTVFEVPLDKKIYFHLDVIKASNEKATGENVYWIAQSHDDFGTRDFLRFSRAPKNQRKLHDLLNNLNKGSIFGQKYLRTPNGQDFLLDYHGEKIKNPQYDYHIHTAKSTGYVGRNYIATNPYKSKDEKREGTFFGNLKYTATMLGRGVWIEGINYKPEFKEQGAFIIAVEKPQILSLLVEKRTRPEKEVRADEVKQGDTQCVAQELMYGDMLDIHVHLHNVIKEDYRITYECFFEGKSLSNEYSTILTPQLPEKNDNPSLDYNSAFIEELLVDYSWAGITNHKEGENDEDAIQTYTFKILFTPDSAEARKKNYPTLEREITLKVNYKSDFSYEKYEKDYKAKIAKVYQPPLLTQLYEKDCYYRKLEVSSEGYETKLYLLETKDGALLTDDRGTTPKFSVVAGNEKNLKTIHIKTDANVKNCTELLEEDSHKNNTFNLVGVQEYSYENGDSTWNILTNLELLPKVQAYQEELSRTEQELKFKVAYVYDAPNEHLFLWRYLFLYLQQFQYNNPAEFYIKVQSCRYERTIWFNVLPDVEWAAHFAYDYDIKKALFFRGRNVELVKGSATYMSWVAELASSLYKETKPVFDYFTDVEGKKIFSKLQKNIEGFIKKNTKYAYLGFHARYDIEDPQDKKSGTLINYSKIEPYTSALQYQIFAMASLTLVIDLLLFFLTRGGSTSKLATMAKKYEKIKDKADKVLKDNKLGLQKPKITSYIAFYKEMHHSGHYATILQFVFRAQPFIELDTKRLFDSKKLPLDLLKYNLELIAKGKIWCDVDIKYNTHTKEFTLAKSKEEQKTAIKVTKYNKETRKEEIIEGAHTGIMQEGDFFKMESFINLTVKASGKYEQEFEAKWEIFPAVKVSASVDLKLHSAISYVKKIGVDEGGLYIERSIVFDGLKGTYKAKVVAKLEKDDTFEKEPGYIVKTGDEILIFDKKIINLGKKHLFEYLKPHKDYQK